MASGARIFELLDVEPDLVDDPKADRLPKLKGDVVLKDLSFSYAASEDIVRLDRESGGANGRTNGASDVPDVLKHLSLHINPGETVAVVGPTGAGKTTLVSLISRFYDLPREKGAILVDGYDIRDVTRSSLAGQMSMVLQEPFLFSGTVRENIKYNHPGASDEHMVEAAKAVGVHDIVMQLDEGYDTYLAERGVNLSLGQRQLLSFARAIGGGSAHPDTGRGDGEYRQLHGDADTASAATAAERADGNRDSAPLVHDTGRGQDCGAEPGRDSGSGDA